MASNLLSRVEEIKRSTLLFRLLQGSKVLGRLWRSGVRCLSGWSGTCSCTTQNTEFCDAKHRWLGLLREYHGGFPDGLSGDEPFFVIEAMTLRQFTASGLTALVQVPGTETPIRVGACGTCWQTIADLGAVDGTEDYGPALTSVLKIQEALR